MPASLGVRCSPGPPAPRTAAFSDLPADALGLIAHKLSEGPLTEAGRHLANASMTNRALRAAVAGDDHARRCLLRAKLQAKARQLAGSLLSGNPGANQARLCLPFLGLLNLPEQTKLVGVLMDRTTYDPGRFPSVYIFKQLVPHLANMDPLLHAKLAIEATRYTEDHSVSLAIQGLSGGLAHLDEPSIGQLLDKATRLHGIADRASALRSLSRGLDHMNPNQQQRLLQAAMRVAMQVAMTIEDRVAQDRVNAGLCAQLKHLPPSERDRLFNWAINVPNGSTVWPKVVKGLAASAGVLEQRQKETLLTKVLDPTSCSSFIVAQHTKRGIRALAAHMEHLEPDQRLRLVNWTLQHFRGDVAPASLVSGLKHMAPHQQDQLLEAAANVPPSEQGRVVMDFVAALPSLEPAHCGKVVALTLGIVNGWRHEDEDARAQAMGALGPHLKHLEEDHRNTVAERALRMLENYALPTDLLMWTDVPALTLGLGAGMEALQNDLRDKLVNAVAAFAFNPHLFRHKDEYRHSVSVEKIAGAIAGLASGWRHLSGPQFQTLIDAASRLEERIEQARREGRMSSVICDKLKAKLIFGLTTA